MTLIEIFSALRILPRADKLKVMQFLVAELAEEEEPTLQSGATYQIWSPLNSHKAAHKLAQLLETEQKSLIAKTYHNAEAIPLGHCYK